jgi:tetratricopeptide (TPR) repeat protein
MSLFLRLFSADYRAALAAEAAGDLQLAAERYALAGQTEAAVRVHMARAARADTRVEAIRALRDALHWASPDTELRRRVAGELGAALLARAREEGIALERDRDRVRAAAELLVESGRHEEAGDALEAIDDDQGAAYAFERGGVVARMEVALARQAERAEQDRALRSAYAEYELLMRGGNRDQARAALQRCVAAADKKGSYRKLLDELETRLITSGRVVLRRRVAPGAPETVQLGRDVVVCAGPTITIGRDTTCELGLRSAGISREHACIERVDSTAEGGGPGFMLRDLDSRNGTLLGGLPIAGAVPLRDAGQFSLGEECELHFTAAGKPPTLTLRAMSGMDRGLLLIAGAPAQPLALTAAELDASLVFHDGRPCLVPSSPRSPIRLDGEVIARGEAQLIHGDVVVIGDVEMDVT